ncbi:hypothetical protein, partial [Streptomyces sp. NPDC047009]|uniref:hypothetical protein n=1 Tax=Streptomyces sp. NPDC047009 TaxID=3154496 RepID=UPI0033CDF9C1
MGLRPLRTSTPRPATGTIRPARPTAFRPPAATDRVALGAPAEHFAIPVRPAHCRARCLPRPLAVHGARRPEITRTRGEWARGTPVAVALPP